MAPTAASGQIDNSAALSILQPLQLGWWLTALWLEWAKLQFQHFSLAHQLQNAVQKSLKLVIAADHMGLQVPEALVARSACIVINI